MKKLIFGCAALASALALNATVESANTFGILKVVSDQEQVIISVPWVTVGSSSSGTTISPTDLVCTTGLSEGDYMLYYHDGVYSSWAINNSGAWVADTIQEGTKTIGTAASAGLTVARGNALILVRTGTLNDSSAFYLNGQYKSGTETVAMPQGSAAQTAMKFFAPTTAAPVNLNSLTYVGDNRPAPGDIIRYGADKQFFYDGTSWCYYKRVAVTIDDEVEYVTKKMTDSTLPAGVAAIYISVGNNPPTFLL